MMEELMNSTKGSRHIFLSTDEAYYVGMQDTASCNEAGHAAKLGSNGRLLAEHWLNVTAGHARSHSREVLFWGEYPPLLPEDVQFLPSYLMNAEMYNSTYDKQFRARGIRQMVFVSAQGSEPMFPSEWTDN